MFSMLTCIFNIHICQGFLDDQFNVRSLAVCNLGEICHIGRLYIQSTLPKSNLQKKSRIIA